MKIKKMKKILIILFTIFAIHMMYYINYRVFSYDESIVLNEINTISSTLSNQTYSGEEIKQNVVIKYNDIILVEDEDYIVTYSNNINVGTAKVTIQGIGNYTGTITKTFKITPKPIKNLKINVTSTYTYTGKARKASVKIYNNNKLKENKDYTLTYKNTVKTGTATVTIKGKGNYNGTVKKTYKIVPKKVAIKSVIMNTKNTQATITWKKDDQASGYVIYRATSKDGKYTKIKNVANKNTTKYIVKNLNSKKTYYFKIRAYKIFGDKKGYSKYYSDAKTNTGLIAEVTLTSTSNSKNRNTNLNLASKTINGTVLNPGQSFNWFKVVGPATAAKGYKSAPVFVNKKHAYGLGGGVCQVSTTLYQAAKKANLKIVERHTHSLPVSYTTKGKDATVTYGVKNLIIKNNKDYAIKLVTSSNKNSTTCKIYKVNY